MLALLVSPIGKAVGAFLAVAAVVGGVYLYAYQRGAVSERQAILKRSVELLRERNATDDEINTLDDSDLCISLGGRWLPVEQRCE